MGFRQRKNMLCCVFPIVGCGNCVGCEQEKGRMVAGEVGKELRGELARGWEGSE